MTREEFLKQLPELVKNYKPATGVSGRIKDITLLMVVGPSGVGKTSVIDHLELKYIVSDTTRLPRPGEKEGADYYFRQDYDQIVQQLRDGRFIQVAIDSGGDLKATRDDAYPESGFAVMAVVHNAIGVFRQVGFKKTISVFITPPAYGEWMHRLNEHQLSNQQQAKRMDEGKRSLDFALSDEQMHFILNDDLLKAVEQTKNILEGKIDKEREEKARSAARSLLENVGYNKESI